MPDDMIPEENEEQYKKLLPLLQRGFHEPVSIPSSESTQIIDRVRERLMQADYLSSQDDKEPVQQSGQIISSMPSMTRTHPKRARISRFINVLAAVLVVGILISASLLLFRPQSRSSPLTIAATPVTATPGLTARTQANGLEATIHLVTPGPYFLSELLLVDVSLTNHTKTTFRLDGRNQPATLCFSSAITVQMTGKGAPSYAFPRPNIACIQPAYITESAPAQTLTIRQYLPVTNSGEVMITMGATTGLQPLSQFAGHWPSLRIHIDPQVPPERMISLHAQGMQVSIQVPQAARDHLLYMQSISCDNYMDGGDSWTPLPTTVLSRPACPTAHKHWEYIVSAPGYPIVAGKQSS